MNAAWEVMSDEGSATGTFNDSTVLTRTIHSHSIEQHRYLDIQLTPTILQINIYYLGQLWQVPRSRDCDDVYPQHPAVIGLPYPLRPGSGSGLRPKLAVSKGVPDNSVLGPQSVSLGLLESKVGEEKEEKVVISGDIERRTVVGET